MKTAIASIGFHKSAAVVLLLGLLLSFVPFVAFGVEAGTVDITPVLPPTDTTAPIQDVEGGIDLFRQVLSWFAIVFWIAAALFVFYAAFLYLTAAGNEEQVKKASSQLLYAVIAIAVGLMAYGLPAFVKTFLEGGGTTTGTPTR